MKSEAAGMQGYGLYKVQQFVTPQWQLVESFALDNGNIPYFPPPTASDYKCNKAGYKAQADAVLKVRLFVALPYMSACTERRWPADASPWRTEPCSKLFAGASNKAFAGSNRCCW